ncbi:AP2-associated protein kinase 1, partial [Eschrichtius robustus]|nr:AP2-associated protein kinase 1 [Eschrichtius robustus]
NSPIPAKLPEPVKASEAAAKKTQPKARLTDPIPTTETSIAPRQRPKAGQTQPNPGILPIQPALTPRKRATVQPPPQATGSSNQPGLLASFQAVHPATQQPAIAQFPVVAQGSSQQQLIQNFYQQQQLATTLHQQQQLLTQQAALQQKTAVVALQQAQAQPAAAPQPAPAQEPAIQAPIRQQPKVQTTPPPTIQGQKLGSLTPPSSPKAQRAGHRRILSDVTHSAVFGVPASKSTQLLQAAAAEASLNKSKSATTTPSGSPRASQQNVYNPSEGSTWNPFDDDNFSKLTAEELLNKDFAKLGEGKHPEKLGGSAESLIPGFQPTQGDTFAASSFSAGTG